LDALDAIHGFVLLRNGNVVAEGSWAPYRNDVPHMMFSVSKSFTSMAVGLAIDEGHLNLDDRVVDLLPADGPEHPSANLSAMRVRHLLTMTTGHAASTMEAVDPSRLGRAGGDWVRQILALPVEYAPGSRFVYNTGATYLAGIIVQRLTGMRLVDYLRPRLFEPLGITTATWDQDPDGFDVGGYGLSITVEELAAFGQLCLQRGEWHGSRLVPMDWVHDATSYQVPNGPHESPEWEQGYGFQFWRCRYGAYRADGAFGQFAIVWPEHRIVLAITAGIQDMQAVMDVFWSALRPSPADDRRTRRLSTPDGAPSSPREASVLDVPHRLDLAGIESLTLTRDHDHLVLRLGREGVMPLGYGEWLPGMAEDHGQLVDVAAAAAWTDESTLDVRVAFVGTPFVWTLTLVLDAENIGVRVDANVAFGDTHLGDGIATP
jgi:CubicO group peptidase (beta-lactamase class C family)